MCTAAAYWRQGRYEESIAEVELAAKTARELSLHARANELATAGATLLLYVQSEDADPMSVPVSEEYPSIEVLEAIVKMDELREAQEEDNPSKPIAMTLPSGLHGEGARKPKLRRLFPKSQLDSPLRLDFDGSILARKPDEKK